MKTVFLASTLILSLGLSGVYASSTEVYVSSNPPAPAAPSADGTELAAPAVVAPPVVPGDVKPQEEKPSGAATPVVPTVAMPMLPAAPAASDAMPEMTTLKTVKVPFDKNKCAALVASVTGDPVKNVKLQDRRGEPAAIMDQGPMTDEQAKSVEVYGKVAFYFTNGGMKDKLAAATLMTRGVNYTSYCEYTVGGQVIARVFQVE